MLCGVAMNIDIDASGNYTLSGEVGDIAIITATLSGNSDVIATCNVEIVESVGMSMR